MTILEHEDLQRILVDDMADTLEQFVIQGDNESLINYIAQAERYDKLDYDTIWNLAFGLGLIHDDDL